MERMTNSDSWLQYVSQKLAANRFQPMKPEIYQPQGYKYASSRSGFEMSKFGMAEYFFTFAEIPNLSPQSLKQFSSASFKFAISNKEVPLPNGFFEAVFCFPVAITENLHPQTAEYVSDTTPEKHWAAFEMPVVMDLTSKQLHYFSKTPIWGAAYFSGFRRMIDKNLR
jgi:hypothetical protein